MMDSTTLITVILAVIGLTVIAVIGWQMDRDHMHRGGR